MSLRDQLLKAGLANKKKVAKTNRDLKKGRKKNQAQRDSKAERRRREAAAAKAADEARRAQLREERARVLAIREAQAQARRVRKLVRSYALPDREGPASFWHPAPDGRTLLRLRVPESWALDLRAGRLAVAWAGPTPAIYEICVVPDYAADRILEHEPRRVLFYNTEPPADDDPAEQLYGAFGEADRPTIPEPVGAPVRTGALLPLR